MALAFIPTYYGPNVGIPRCRDRQLAWHVYVGECTDNVPGARNRPAPHAIPPGRTAAHYRQLPCIMPAGLPGSLHPNGYTICGSCVEHTESHQWFKLARARITNLPPVNVTSPNNNRAQVGETRHWRGFKTRMCRTCEIREQYLVLARQNGLAIVTVPPVANQVTMENYPVNTCTCLWYFSHGNLCVRDQKRIWNRIRRNPTELCQRRDDNREWLRTSAAHPVTGALWTANQVSFSDL